MMIRTAVLSRSQSGPVDLDRTPSHPWTGPCGAIASVVVFIAGGEGRGEVPMSTRVECSWELGTGKKYVHPDPASDPGGRGEDGLLTSARTKPSSWDMRDTADKPSLHLSVAAPSRIRGFVCRNNRSGS